MQILALCTWGCRRGARMQYSASTPRVLFRQCSANLSFSSAKAPACRGSCRVLCVCCVHCVSYLLVHDVAAILLLQLLDSFIVWMCYVIGCEFIVQSMCCFGLQRQLSGPRTKPLTMSFAAAGSTQCTMYTFHRHMTNYTIYIYIYIYIYTYDIWHMLILTSNNTRLIITMILIVINLWQS